MAQLAIDFSAPAQRHSATSVAAAERITPHLGAMQQRALDFIRANPGCCDNEICLGVNSPNGGRARRIELYRAGLIEKAGVRDGCTTWRVK